MEPSVHDKSKRTVIHERVMGNMRDIGLPSASCVVYVPVKQHCPCTCS